MNGHYAVVFSARFPNTRYAQDTKNTPLRVLCGFVFLVATFSRWSFPVFIDVPVRCKTSETLVLLFSETQSY